jgi:hypothetical protein
MMNTNVIKDAIKFEIEKIKKACGNTEPVEYTKGLIEGLEDSLNIIDKISS